MNEPVLLLNGNYEPINVCNTKRAMGLILVDKAMVLENGRGLIHTVSRAYERPSVIRLIYMVRRPRSRVRLCKREIFAPGRTPLPVLRAGDEPVDAGSHRAPAPGGRALVGKPGRSLPAMQPAQGRALAGRNTDGVATTAPRTATHCPVSLWTLYRGQRRVGQVSGRLVG